jgi:hypothetical protein
MLVPPDEKSIRAEETDKGVTVVSWIGGTKSLPGDPGGLGRVVSRFYKALYNKTACTEALYLNSQAAIQPERRVAPHLHRAGQEVTLTAHQAQMSSSRAGNGSLLRPGGHRVLDSSPAGAPAVKHMDEGCDVVVRSVASGERV